MCMQSITESPIWRCADDINAYCDWSNLQNVYECLNENVDHLSPECYESTTEIITPSFITDADSDWDSGFVHPDFEFYGIERCMLMKGLFMLLVFLGCCCAAKRVRRGRMRRARQRREQQQSVNSNVAAPTVVVASVPSGQPVYAPQSVPMATLVYPGHPVRVAPPAYPAQHYPAQPHIVPRAQPTPHQPAVYPALPANGYVYQPVPQ